MIQFVEVTGENGIYFKDYLPEYLREELADEQTQGEYGTIGGVLAETGEAVGVLVLSASEDRFCLEWIFVHPRFRRQGCGGEMLRYAMEKILNIPNIRSIYTEYGMNAETVALDFLLESEDFEMRTVSRPVFCFRADQVKLPSIRDEQDESIHILSDLQSLHQNRFVRFLQEHYYAAAVEIPIQWGRFEQDLSVVRMVEDDVKGILLFQKQGEVLELAYGFVSPENPIVLIHLLDVALRKIKEKYGSNQLIMISAITNISGELVHKLVQSTEPLELRHAEYILL